MRKIIPIILIGVVMFGTFSPILPGIENLAEAQVACTSKDANGNFLPTGCDPNLGFCFVPSAAGSAGGITHQNLTQAQCTARGSNTAWTSYVSGITTATTGAASDDEKASTFLGDKLQKCGVFGVESSIVGCFVQITYFVLIGILTFVLKMTAQFFDYMAMLTLSSQIYSKEFIFTIWGIVRDFSNIFFILVLLYAALEMILGIGHNPRKTVAAVILMALLVNFSLFFTRVVVDASNILGLIFYNRIDTTTFTNKPISKNGEKGISAALVSSFNINTFFSEETITRARTRMVAGTPITDPTLSASMSLSLMAVYAIVILPLAYAFLIVGLSFLGRMVTLMILMMVSPFAFMSYAVPALRKKDTIGFDSWLHKLLETSFMAAVFMFLLYIVNVILNAKIFNDIDPTQGISETLIGIFVPAVVIIIVLLKGAKYAKKASGEFTDSVMKGAGLLGGAALGGAAILGTGAIGAATKGAQVTGLSKYLEGKTENKGISGWAARTALKTGNYTQKASFDLRNVPGLSGAMKKSGIDLSSASAVGLGVREGGYKGDVERRAKKLKEESELYKTSMTDKEVQDWSAKRMDEWKAAGSIEADKPKEFSSARQLNEHRMEQFKDRLGIEGFLGATMYSTVGRVAGAMGATEEGKKNAAIWGKRVVGIGLGATVGGYIGGSTIGGAGAIAKGAALGTGYTLGYGATQGAAEKKADKDIEKDMKKEKEIEERLARQKEKLEKQAGVLDEASEEEAKKPEKDRLVWRTGEEDSGQPVFEINSKALEDALRESAVQQKRGEGALQALTQKIASQGGEYRDNDRDNEKKYMSEIKTAMEQTARYTTIKNTHNDMSTTRMDIFKITSDKHRMEEERKGHGKKGTTSSTPKADHSEEKHEESHDNAPPPTTH